MAEMTNKDDHTDSTDFIIRDEIDELFGRASPNVERIGCPSRTVLSELARRARPMDDPAYEHLGQCSPCYREFRALQEQAASSENITLRSSAPRWIAAAVIVALVATGLWFYLKSRTPSGESVQAGRDLPAPTTSRATLDLRPFAISRSPQDPSGAAPLVLPRGKFVATILLAVGAEPGAYEVEIRDLASHRLTAAGGNAQLVNFVATLEMTIDLQAASPGPSQLAVRHAGDDWRSFPAIIR